MNIAAIHDYLSGKITVSAASKYMLSEVKRMGPKENLEWLWWWHDRDVYFKIWLFLSPRIQIYRKDHGSWTEEPQWRRDELHLRDDLYLRRKDMKAEMACWMRTAQNVLKRDLDK